MNKAPKRTLSQRLYRLFEDGLEVMARYPYDLNETHWYVEPPEPSEKSKAEQARRANAQSAPSKRPIKLVPPLAAKRYQASQSKPLPVQRPTDQ